MTPYYSDGDFTIYHGNCIEILPSLGKCDLILTDPPYGVNYVTSWRARSDELRKPIANDESLDCFGTAWPLMLGRLSNDRHWYVFASPRKIHEALLIVGSAKHAIAWDKGDRGTVGDLVCGFGEAWEAILYGMKGRRPINGKRPRTVIRFDWSGSLDPLHPTVKPIGLLEKLICWSTNEGETILDPFMGSGTTLRAAKNTGRKAIGIEVDEKYCEVAANRLRQGVLF